LPINIRADDHAVEEIVTAVVPDVLIVPLTMAEVEAKVQVPGSLRLIILKILQHMGLYLQV